MNNQLFLLFNDHPTNFSPSLLRIYTYSNICILNCYCNSTHDYWYILLAISWYSSHSMLVRQSACISCHLYVLLQLLQCNFELTCVNVSTLIVLMSCTKKLSRCLKVATWWSVRDFVTKSSAPWTLTKKSWERTSDRTSMLESTRFLVTSENSCFSCTKSNEFLWATYRQLNLVRFYRNVWKYMKSSLNYYQKII